MTGPDPINHPHQRRGDDRHLNVDIMIRGINTKLRIGELELGAIKPNLLELGCAERYAVYVDW